jgi:hypothetical protein
MPISKERSDYVISVIIVLAITAATVLAVFLTHPVMLHPAHKFLGIKVPYLEGAFMRQPRMSAIISVGARMLCTSFIFIARPALPFFSRPLAWGASIVSVIALLAVGFFNHAGKHGAWFRFFVLCIVVTVGLSVMAELMIFYRRLIHDKKFRTNIFHRIAFTIVCTALASAIAFMYFHKGVHNGVFIDYGVKSNVPSIQTPTTPDLGTTATIPQIPSTSAP